LDEGVKAGLVTSVLGGVILLGLIAFAVQGPSYVWLAVLVFGFVAAGFIGMGLYSIMQGARHSAT
jgi:hypothetical protein